MTLKQKQDYLNHAGQRCPHCNSTHITADTMAVPDGMETYQDVTCLECNKTWRDIYKLVSVENS